MLLFIFSIVILIFILYICIPRHVKLRFRNTFSLGQQYMNLPRCSAKKTIIYFYLNKADIKNFKQTLNSILDQSHRVDMINVIADESIQDNEIPLYISDVSIVSRCRKKHYFKNLIRKEKEAFVNILFLKASFVYDKNFINSIIAETENKESPVCTPQYIYTSTEMFDENIFQKKNLFNLNLDFH
jgi:hypothetical protein